MDEAESIKGQGAQLEIEQGNTVSLIGGYIELDNVKLNVETGQVNLISVASAGEVGLSESTLSGDFDITSVSSLDTVRIYNDSMVNVDGEGGGRIFIRAGNLLISNNSKLSSKNVRSYGWQRYWCISPKRLKDY